MIRTKYTIAVVLGFFLTLVASLASRAQTPTFLVLKQHLVYEGSFRVPSPGFDGAGRPTAFNPANGTLLMARGGRNVVELNIPAIHTGASVSDLDVATIRTPWSPMSAPENLQCSEAKLLGGILPWGTDLITSVYCYFEDGQEKRSHFRFRNGAISGPVQVGTIGAGFVSGAMTPIPAEWQASFGGPALTSNWSIPIISRTSAGPAASVFNPADVGSVNPVPATPVVGYPMGHWTIGTADSNGTLYSSTQYAGGLVFPPGTSTVLFFGGRKAMGQFCYGPGTTDPSLHLTPYPDAPTTENWCYDPVNLDKGTHGYPYAHFVYAYNAADLVAVKNGEKAPWDVVPYATWTFDLPFQYGQRVIQAATYDAVTKRIYLVAENGDGDNPLVHVFKVDVAASVPAPTPEPLPEPIPAPQPEPPPPTVDVCLQFPGVLTVSQWPNPNEGSRRLTYSYTVNGAVTTVAKVALAFGPPDTLAVTDARGCAALYTR